MKIALPQITFVIPVRIDSNDRLRNLDYVVWYLQTNFDTRISIIENDKKSFLSNRFSGIDYEFQFDSNDLFHRTRIINSAVKKVTTDYVAIYDADVIFPVVNYLESLQLLQAGCFDVIYPYNRNYIDIPNKYAVCGKNIDFDLVPISERFNISPINGSVGGAFFINRKKYIDVGLENENFTSWGYEDDERFVRFKIMGLKIGFYGGSCLYHLHHSRGLNNNFNYLSGKYEEEFKKVSMMSKSEIISYFKLGKSGI